MASEERGSSDKEIDEKDKLKRLSDLEHKVNALAIGAEEGRGKLRKAMVRSKHPQTHGYPNAGTQLQ